MSFFIKNNVVRGKRNLEIMLRFKINRYLRQAHKYSQKSNRAKGSLERNHYFQKYIYYQNKARLLEDGETNKEII